MYKCIFIFILSHKLYANLQYKVKGIEKTITENNRKIKK